MSGIGSNYRKNFNTESGGAALRVKEFLMAEERVMARVMVKEKRDTRTGHPAL
jgi:hypothetical protein